MIVICENCQSEFNVDESRVKEGGSKVRCSVCKNVFMVHPPKEESIDEPVLVEELEEEFEETVAIDSVPEVEKKVPKRPEEALDASFDKAFEEAMVEEVPRRVSTEELDMEGAIDRASRVEEELGITEPGRKIPKKRAEVKKAPEPAPLREKPERSMFLPVFLIFIFLILGGAAVVFFLTPELIPDSLSFLKPMTSQEMTDVGARRLSLKAVTGSFMESDKAGQLFVIKGMVTNEYPKRRNFILLKGAILDDKGQVIKRKLSYAGNIFKEEQLKSMSLDDLNRGSKNRFGKGRMNFNIEPGNSIPFMIVFDNLPENMTEFTVEAVSSSQAK